MIILRPEYQFKDLISQQQSYEQQHKINPNPQNSQPTTRTMLNQKSELYNHYH